MSKRIERFEDLIAWQKAMDVGIDVYEATRKRPFSRDFALTDQIHKSVISVPSNIAEGFERSSVPEKLQFYNFARGSAGEVRSLLYVVSDNFPKSCMVAEGLRTDTVGVGKLISGLILSTESAVALSDSSVLGPPPLPIS